MHTKDPYENRYIITFFYGGKKLTYRLYNYHNEIKYAWYYLYANGRTLEFTYERATGKVAEVLQHNQPPVPDDFLWAISTEIKEIHKEK